MKAIKTTRAILVDTTIDGTPVLLATDGSVLPVYNCPALSQEPLGTYAVLFRTADFQPWMVAEICNQESTEYRKKLHNGINTLIDEIQMFSRLLEEMGDLGIETLAQAAHWLVQGKPRVSQSDC
jgi:hypothetical protein